MSSLATKISWTEVTANPIAGCTKVSQGCDHCYALTMALRLARIASARLEAGQRLGRLAPYLDVVDMATGEWTDAIVEVPDVLADFTRWKKPKQVFVNSMSDLFHKSVTPAYRNQVFDAMEAAPHHRYQILTKRSSVMRDFVLQRYGGPTPDFIWCGASLESETELVRADHMRAIGGWLSLEPLLSPLPVINLVGIPWIVIGGESGAGARPCMSDWISDLIKIARCHGSIVYVKQLGARSDIAVHGKGDDPADWPEALRCRHFPPGLDPKALAGGSVPAICGEAGRCHETT